MNQSPKLLMVYNADGGMVNAVLHGVHKVLRPSTYPCSLCALTYGLVSMRSEWRRFLDGLGVEPVFHHSDDFAAAYPSVSPALPAILLQQVGGEPEVLIAAAQMDELPSLGALKVLVTQRLAQELGSRILPA
ncbi:MAG: hypothetical protein ABJ242_01110 [Marinomonas sp.]